MSDSYQALADCGAAPGEGRALAASVVDVLARQGLIVPSASAECVLDGFGYPAGPGCADAYGAPHSRGRRRGHEFWTLETSGVEVHAEPWVNTFGFTAFDGAACPRCAARRADDFVDDVGACVDAFTRSGIVPSITCPSCSSVVSIHDWVSDPHFGFVNLAVVFWNWPSFDDARWTANIHTLLEGELKRPFVSTRGRV